MKKSKIILLCCLLTILIPFTTAYNGYGGFSLRDLLDNIDSSTLLLGAIFIISFAVLNFVLSKFFRTERKEPNKAVSGIISLVLSILIVYGINKTNFDIRYWFYDIGIPEGLLSIIVPLILLAGVGYLSYSRKYRKFKFCRPFLILGVLFILFGIFLAYEKTLSIVIGAVLFLIGFIIWAVRKREREIPIRIGW